MKLHDLLKEIKDEKLNKTQLEDYHTLACQLRADISLALGEKQKEEAIFLAQRDSDESVASRKINWKATDSGQRLIELKSYAVAIKSAIEGLKSRIYSKL